MVCAGAGNGARGWSRYTQAVYYYYTISFFTLILYRVIVPFLKVLLVKIVFGKKVVTNCEINWKIKNELNQYLFHRLKFCSPKRSSGKYADNGNLISYYPFSTNRQYISHLAAGYLTAIIHTYADMLIYILFTQNNAMRSIHFNNENVDIFLTQSRNNSRTKISHRQHGNISHTG